MKPFLILQLRPEDDTSNNEFETILKYGKLQPEETVRVRIEKTGIPETIDPHDYSAIIVGGSPFDISTPENEKSDIQKKIESDFVHLFDVVVKEDIPFLGACSGNGLLGSYCGSNISTKYNEPVSATDITLTKEGLRDPLLKGFPKTFRAFVGHKESCDTTPESGVLLADNEACPVQMFRLGRNVYATQFHPEADAEGMIVRFHAYKNHGYFPPEDLNKMIAGVENQTTPYANKILERFVARYKN